MFVSISLLCVRSTSHVVLVSFAPAPYDAVPDRQTGIRGWCELRSVSPSRRWNFVEVNVLADELHEHHNQVPAHSQLLFFRLFYIHHAYQIMQLLHPSTSLMDHSIAAATWFAARGQGACHHGWVGVRVERY